MTNAARTPGYSFADALLLSLIAGSMGDYAEADCEAKAQSRLTKAKAQVFGIPNSAGRPETSEPMRLLNVAYQYDSQRAQTLEEVLKEGPVPSRVRAAIRAVERSRAAQARLERSFPAKFNELMRIIHADGYGRMKEVDDDLALIGEILSRHGIAFDLNAQSLKQRTRAAKAAAGQKPSSRRAPA